jgi:hypothetical protein
VSSASIGEIEFEVTPLDDRARAVRRPARFIAGGSS